MCGGGGGGCVRACVHGWVGGYTASCPSPSPAAGGGGFGMGFGYPPPLFCGRGFWELLGDEHTPSPPILRVGNSFLMVSSRSLTTSSWKLLKFRPFLVVAARLMVVEETATRMLVVPLCLFLVGHPPPTPLGYICGVLRAVMWGQLQQFCGTPRWEGVVVLCLCIGCRCR